MVMVLSLNEQTRSINRSYISCIFQIITMRGLLIAGLMILIVAPGILEAVPVTEERENEVVEW